MTSFEALGVGAPILRALEHMGFTEPTEIQEATIPTLMEGTDVVGVAQTGGGKTAAFVIPMLERLSGFSDRPKPGMPRALILAPTRELAIQITDKIKELAVGSNVRACTVYGGAPYKTQIHILRRGVDVLIATPGRLQDHMKQGNIYLDETEYFVLDEADRMLDMGFVDEVRQIARKLPTGHQSVMFSATMNAKVTALAEDLLHDAVRVEVARQATIANNLEHKVMLVPGPKKKDLLLDLIEAEQPEKTLIFERTRRDADQMCEYLEAVGFKADSIHGDKKQKIRQRTINAFKDGRFDFLVATDVAARGIDVNDITHVFNYDVPVEAESYVHRIGRTARGGAHGRAITLCGKNEMRLLRDIEALIQMKIEVDYNHAYPLSLNKSKGGSSAGDRRGRANGERRGRSNGDRDRKPFHGRDRTAGGGRDRSRTSEKGRNRDADFKPRAARPDARKASDFDTIDHADAPTREERKRPARPARDGAKRDERKPYAKRREDRPNGHADSRSSSQSQERTAGKPTGKGTDKKRIDPSLQKRKSKAGAKAKKRPAVAARKAKAMKTKNFSKPAGAKKGAQGGNAPLRRRAN